MKPAIRELEKLRTERESFYRDYESRERDCVIQARMNGRPWEEIAQALGRTRSAVWQKYHHVADGPSKNSNMPA